MKGRLGGEGGGGGGCWEVEEGEVKGWLDLYLVFGVFCLRWLGWLSFLDLSFGLFFQLWLLLDVIIWSTDHDTLFMTEWDR